MASLDGQRDGRSKTERAEERMFEAEVSGQTNWSGHRVCSCCCLILVLTREYRLHSIHSSDQICGMTQPFSLLLDYFSACTMG